MSLADSYDEQEGKDNNGAEPLWKAKFDGADGEIQTGPLDDDFDPHDFSAVLEHLGYKPGEIRMELVAATRWQQRVSGAWLNAYRYRATMDGLNVNLPALYAELAGERPQLARSTGTTKSTAVVCWADIQTGKVDELGGLKELLTRLEDKRHALIDYLYDQDVDHIIVADVGDILEGFENTAQQQTTNCLSLMDQVDVAATEFWKTIRTCESFGKVDVLSIPSNHAQWRKGKNLLGRPNDDWGIHISKRLQRHNEEAGLNIEFHRPDEWSETLQFKVRDTTLGLAHGHQARQPDKVKDWWAKMTHGGVLDCDVLLTGHFHFPSLRPSGRNPRTNQTRWHVQASTLDNGSAWVRNAMGEDGDPALTVFQINDDGFDTGSFRLL